MARRPRSTHADRTDTQDPLNGRWSFFSESDARWNATGRGFIVPRSEARPLGCEQAEARLAELTAQYGTPPTDLLRLVHKD